MRFSCVNNLRCESYDAVINLHKILDAQIFTEMSGAGKVVNYPLITYATNSYRNVTIETLGTLRYLDKTN